MVNQMMSPGPMDLAALRARVVAASGAAGRAEGVARDTAGLVSLQKSLVDLGTTHLRDIGDRHTGLSEARQEALGSVWSKARTPQELWAALLDYGVDAAQRGVLFLDIMRQVGNNFAAQQRDGAAPVLMYDYEMVVDGRTLERPVGYAMVRILPPAGVVVDDARRPYMLIDPRAGHGPGIGGFKSDSQVGVALAHGHPVYFVIFFPQPEPGQTIADVSAAELLFVREVVKRHPRSGKPVVVGNCQGGWAAMLLAAGNPDVMGPLVINGAPLDYWAGVRGRNPLRYMGGLAGGAVPAMIAADLGNGKFDGAYLVDNFEKMNPGNTKFMKYYNVFANVDTEAERFIAFEKWWSGFYFMNGEEISWIVENLFIGNKLTRGEARLGGRGTVDLRQIRSPIVVFASHGDDITPPQQALNWISDLYLDEHEIAVRGQRIIYMVHPDVGHLGIFVSAKVALREHDRIVSTVEAIESLAPGLYEMRITEKRGEGIAAEFTVGFEERTMADIRAFDDVNDDASFAVVRRYSEFGVDAYEMTARPLVKAMVTPASADFMVKTHPLRLRRYVTSDLNPAMRSVATLAPAVKAARKPVAPDNPFFMTEKLFAGMVEQGMNFWRDVKAATDELTFFALYANPFLAPLARAAQPSHEQPAHEATIGEGLRELPQVQAALMNIARGGFAEAVIRMLILMAKARGSVRQNRLERSNMLLTSAAPFNLMTEAMRSAVINEQSLIVDFEPEAAITSLPALLEPDEVVRAVALVEEIAGEVAEMNPPTVAMLARLRGVLGVVSH